MSPLFTELEITTLDVDQWPEPFVAELLNLLKDSEFQRTAESWKLLNFLSNNWAQFPANHKSQLRQVLARTFDCFGDPMGAFTAAEILGEHFCDKETLDIFARLTREAIPPANTLVPHGLEVFARSTTEVALRELAMTQLRHMTENTSTEVRREASDSLRRLKDGSR